MAVIWYHKTIGSICLHSRVENDLEKQRIRLALTAIRIGADETQTADSRVRPWDRRARQRTSRFRPTIKWAQEHKQLHRTSNEAKRRDFAVVRCRDQYAWKAESEKCGSTHLNDWADERGNPFKDQIGNRYRKVYSQRQTAYQSVTTKTSLSRFLERVRNEVKDVHPRRWRWAWNANKRRQGWQVRVGSKDIQSWSEANSRWRLAWSIPLKQYEVSSF